MDATVKIYQLRLIQSKGLCFIRFLVQATVVRGRAAEGRRLSGGWNWDRLTIST